MPSKDIKCAHCGTRPMDKYSSGTPECWRCWYRRKMDLPAASYYARATPELDTALQAWMSQLDMWDYMHYFPACGLTKGEGGTIDELFKAIEKVKELTGKIGAYSQTMIEAGFGDMPNEEELSKTRDKEDAE